MPSEASFEVYRQLRQSQDKYAYFLLAVAGSAIAFAATRSEHMLLTKPMFLLGLAVLSWGLSFFCGCRHLLYVSATLYANASLLKVESGTHPEVGQNPTLMSAASEGIREAIHDNSRGASRHAFWQFRLLLLGIVLYVVWQVVEMALRTWPALKLPWSA